MKFIHLSDLHIGKRVNGFSMMEDQEYILNEIINIIDNEEPQAVILAGDIYDKAIPQADAVELLDDFLVKLSERRLQVFVISGNHDSPERLAFGRRLMEDSGIYVAPVYDGNVKPFTVKDDYGEVNIFLLPFIKPVHVRKAFPQQVHEIESYNDAVRVAIENMDIDSSVRSVLVTHQFVTGAVRSESEDMTLSAGGSDNIDCGIFTKFDYVALGHHFRGSPAGPSLEDRPRHGADDLDGQRHLRRGRRAGRRTGREVRGLQDRHRRLHGRDFRNPLDVPLSADVPDGAARWTYGHGRGRLHGQYAA